MNYLAPTVRREPWSIEEDRLLIQKINEMGTHWSGIANFFIGRTDNHVKNRWYSFLKNRVRCNSLGQYYLLEREGTHDESVFRGDVTVQESESESNEDQEPPEPDFWDARLLDSSKQPEGDIFSEPPNETRDVRADCFSSL
jgi:hypothetical protein